MPTFVALLRAVNVLGANPVRMADLRADLAARGLADVATYLASGNAVFASTEPDPASHAATVRDALAAQGGPDVGVLVLPAADLSAIEAANPLLGAPDVDPAFLHATFLFEPVPAEAFQALTLPAQPGERAVPGAGVVYLYCPHGYGRTKLNNAFFENRLKVPATTRNGRTVRALAQLCRERNG